jgi:glycosyltransferase involved in cell wall biosynthesis
MSDRRPEDPFRIAIVAAESRRVADGIRDYTDRLVEHLGASDDLVVSLLARGANGDWRGAIDGNGPVVGRRGVPPPALLRADAVVLQYNPFSFGRRGFAPSVPALLWRVRARRHRPVIAVMFHETFVDMKSPRWLVMGAWQRLQLVAMQGACDVQFSSIERWAERIRRGWPGKAVHHLPVGSNMPDMRQHRASARAELGVPDDAVVLACFGLRHPGRLERPILESARAVAATGRSTLLLNFGTLDHGLAPPVEGVTIREPGVLDAVPLARMLAASDVFLAPYADGVSTRRTTVMTALQHAVAVVATDGHLTDGVLRRARSAMRLAPVGEPARFVEAVRELADDGRARTAMGGDGRRLYEESFDWPVVTGRMVDILRRAATTS